MRKKSLQLFISLFFASLIYFLFLPVNVFAQESISNFTVTLVAHKSGSMTVTENILYDFVDTPRHGIYRTIPLVSRVGNLYRVISINFTSVKRDGQSESYSVDRSAKETTVKIGNASKTITGAHNYSVQYEVENGIGSNYADHDEIYWNVTGNDWTVPIEKASFTIQTDFGVLPGKTICFTGARGTTQRNCLVEEIEGPKIVTTTYQLALGEGLTIVSAFPPNTFPKSILQKSEPSVDPDFLTFLKILIPVYFLLNFFLAPGILYWYFKHKNKKRFGPAAVNFDLPQYPKGERISPAQAGTIDNAKLDKDDIIATIFDLAIRKYIKIEQVKKKGGLLGIGKSEDYKLIKLKSFDDLNDFEKNLANTIFKTSDSVLLKDVKLDYSDFLDLEKNNFTSLIERSFYTKNPKVQMGGLLVFGIISTVTFNLILGPVLIWLSRKLNGRSALGDEIDFKIDGLKIFLKNMSRYYKWQAEKAYVVESMIPYAIALGCIDEYMKQLKILNPKYQPAWYSGNFYSSYAFMSSSFSNNVTTTAPSSSSGFSGGFSGGGGGGGGGGSW